MAAPVENKMAEKIKPCPFCGVHFVRMNEDSDIPSCVACTCGAHVPRADVKEITKASFCLRGANND